MNKIASSSTERLVVHAHAVAGKETLNDASNYFPSYLRVFGNFFEVYAAKSHWGAAQSMAASGVRFPTAPGNVAFV
jgi:hypothetical protein